MRDGTGMLMEPLAGEATEGNLGPVGRVAYAFSTMAGVIVQPDITTTANRAQIIALAAKHRLPAVYPFRFLTNEGGLASYGIDVIDGYKRSATYVDRILRGEKPGDLPVQAPIKFELSVN
jgi:putative ABC transport system substrate-binding protein